MKKLTRTLVALALALPVLPAQAADTCPCGKDCPCSPCHCNH
ncbi:MAG TPA: hypothetical protein VHO25_01700 [Polyangiaceae bacterium]|nr:hypothetical protein [Polyangiaceae bacterium]